MPGKTFVLSQADVMTLDGRAVDKLIRLGDGDAALLFLYMSRTKGPGTAESAAGAMGKSVGWAATALTSLSRIGLIKSEDGEEYDTFAPHTERKTVEYPKNPPVERVSYTIEEIAREIETSSGFSALINETQRILGKKLSEDELKRLYELYDLMKFPVEVIMLLITFCVEESRRKGWERMPSMRYIERTACTWESEGINSLESAEKYLKALEARRSARGKIKEAMQIRDRGFSVTEKRIVDSWIDNGFLDDAVEIAYDKTIVNTGKLSIGYMDKIMSSWHDKGIHTAHEIISRDVKAEHRKPGESKKGTDGKFGESSRDEIERMQKLLKKIKDEE